MTKAELEKKLNAALKEANSAINSINNISLPDFSSSMDIWAKIIDENADTKSGDDTWKSIKNKSKDIDNYINRIISDGCSALQPATGELYVSSSEVQKNFKSERF